MTRLDRVSLSSLAYHDKGMPNFVFGQAFMPYALLDTTETWAQKIAKDEIEGKNERN